jgi:hypothetical protein
LGLGFFFSSIVEQVSFFEENSTDSYEKSLMDNSLSISSGLPDAIYN